MPAIKACPADPMLLTFTSAIADDLQLLALLHDREISSPRLEQLQEFSFVQDLQVKLHSAMASETVKRLDQVTAGWAKECQSELIDELASDYAAIYLNHTYRASPLESVWIDDENLSCQQPMFRVRKIYEKYGLACENWRMRSDDHLVCQIQFYIHLLKSEVISETIIKDLAQFYDEHLFRWLGKFSQRVADRCHTEFYALLAILTHCYLEQIRDFFGEILETPRPAISEIESRMAKGMQAEPAVELKYFPGVTPGW